MVYKWETFTEKRSYSSTTLTKYARSCIIFILLVLCLTSVAEYNSLKLQENFDPHRFFNNIWYETHRVNKTLTNYGRCVSLEFSMDGDNINAISSAYVPFLFRRIKNKSLLKLEGQNKPYFLMDAKTRWNCSIISTDYDNYSLVSCCNAKNSMPSMIPPCPGIIITFRRKKNDDDYVEELVSASKKIGISKDQFFKQYC